MGGGYAVSHNEDAPQVHVGGFASNGATIVTTGNVGNGPSQFGGTTTAQGGHFGFDMNVSLTKNLDLFKGLGGLVLII